MWQTIWGSKRSKFMVHAMFESSTVQRANGRASLVSQPLRKEEEAGSRDYTVELGSYSLQKPIQLSNTIIQL